MSCPLHVPNGYARMKTQLRPTTSFGGRMEGHGHQYARAAAAGSERGEGSGEDDPHHAGATGSSPDERVERRLFRPGDDSQAVAHPRAGPCTGRSRERAGTAGGSVRRQAGAARSAAARGGAGGTHRILKPSPGRARVLTIRCLGEGRRERYPAVRVQRAVVMGFLRRPWSAAMARSSTASISRVTSSGRYSSSAARRVRHSASAADPIAIRMSSELQGRAERVALYYLCLHGNSGSPQLIEQRFGTGMVRTIALRQCENGDLVSLLPREQRPVLAHDPICDAASACPVPNRRGNPSFKRKLSRSSPFSLLPSAPHTHRVPVTGACGTPPPSALQSSAS